MASTQENIWRMTSFLLIHVMCMIKGQLFFGQDPPVMDIEAVKLTVKQGGTARLPCTVGNIGDNDLSWMKGTIYQTITNNTTVIVDDKRISVDHSQKDEWTLVISNVQYSDADQYTCMLLVIPPSQKFVVLEVYGLPAIDKESLKERYIVKRGEPLHITCKAAGRPSPNVRWYTFKTKPGSVEEQKELVSSDANLSLSYIDRTHDGIYRCEAENSYGMDMYETFIQTSYPPEPTTEDHIIYVKEGALARLQCEAESLPKPRLAWQREKGEIIEQSWKYHVQFYADSETKLETSLEFEAKKEDEGRYFCLASNTHGQNNLVIKVIVAEEGATQTPGNIVKETTTRRKWVTRKPTTHNTSENHENHYHEKSTEETTYQHNGIEGPVTGKSTSDASSVQISTLTLLFIFIFTFLVL